MVFACVGLALATGAANASAAPSWLPPQDISGPTESITVPDLAVNAAGNAVAVWPRESGGETTLEALERPAGGQWSTTAILSDPDEEEEPKRASVALDAAGNAVAVWGAFSDPGFVIRGTTRPAGGEWSAPEDLSIEGVGGRAPSLAIDAEGDAVVVWTGFAGGSEGIWAAVRPLGGEWSSPQVISAAGEIGSSPRVATDAAGDAVVVWQRLVDGDDPIRTAARPAGGEWSAPETVSGAGENGGPPRIAMNGAGLAVAAWTDFLGGGDGVRAAVRSPSGEWSAVEGVSADGESTGDPELAIDPSGEAFAIWSGPEGGDLVLRTATLPVGGEWSAVEEVSGAAPSFNSYDLEASATAGVVATWTRHDGANYGVQAAVRPPGGEWSGPDDLSTEGEDAGLPDLKFDADGNAIAIWGRDTGEDYVLQGSGYDRTGPRLDDLRIPATGAVGKPLSFSVSPFDLFSLGATGWTFGDGGQAAGDAVSHVYAAPGVYSVTVGAVDESGNASTRTAAITIAAPRRRIALALRIEKKSRQKLLRTGTLSIAAGVNDAASVALNGRARLRVRSGGEVRTRLVSIFAPRTVRFGAAGERKVTLELSKRGREAVRSLSRVKLLIGGEARDDSGGLARATVARTYGARP